MLTDEAIEVFAERLDLLMDIEHYGSETREKVHRAVGHAHQSMCDKFQDFGRFAGQFTSHGPDHSARVLGHAIELASRLDSLKARELLALGLAAILHDIGMVLPFPAHLPVPNTQEEMWALRRKQHAELTAGWLVEDNATRRLITEADADMAEALPHICGAHTTDGFADHVKVLRGLSMRAARDGPRWVTLAGFLLLADELDIGCERAEPELLRYREFASAVTRAHWWKHWSVVRAGPIDGHMFEIVPADSKCVYGAEELIRWAWAKLRHQIRMLQDHLDPAGTDSLWRLNVVLCDSAQPQWMGQLPPLTKDVLEAAQAERVKIPGQKLGRVIEPRRLIEGCVDRDATENPSDFFRNCIARCIGHFRGHGHYVRPETAWSVWVEGSNGRLLSHTIDEWSDYMRSDSRGVNCKIFTGGIGVGKTHFVSVFLHQASARERDLAAKALFVRAEMTQCRSTSLLQAKRTVVRRLFRTLVDVGLQSKIRDAMKELYSTDVPPQVPRTKQELVSWDEDKVDGFIEAIGEICNGASELRDVLGESAPDGLVLLLDNMDQLDDEVTLELCNWAYSISGRAHALLWLFLRPETLARLQEMQQRWPVQTRSPERIVAPSLKAVVARRTETFPGHLKEHGHSEIAFGEKGDKAVTPEDIGKAIQHITDMAFQTDKGQGLLHSMTEQAGGDGEINLRAGLQGILGILGSRIIKDADYSRAILRSKTADGSTLGIGWPRILESLILGRRIWYSAQGGVVENLVDPPEVEQYADYFLLVHLLQHLTRDAGDPYAIHRFGAVCAAMQQVGYPGGRVQRAAQYLWQRLPFGDDVDDPSVDQFPGRTFPLLKLPDARGSSTWPRSLRIRATPWGRYHVASLLTQQAQYWKHLSYQIVLPSSVCRALSLRDVHASSGEDLNQFLSHIFDFLGPIEERWLAHLDEDELTRLGIRKVIPRIRKVVEGQLKVS